MTEVIEIIEIDWCKPPTNPTDYYPIVACCGICDESATDDFANRKTPRQFYQQNGGALDGYIICEHCIDDYLKETPT